MYLEPLLVETAKSPRRTAIAEREGCSRPHYCTRLVNRPEDQPPVMWRVIRHQKLAAVGQRLAHGENARARWPKLRIGLAPDLAEVNKAAPTSDQLVAGFELDLRI